MGTGMPTVAQRIKGKAIALWALSGVLATLSLMAGGSKLAGADQHIQHFAHWGYPDWFRLVAGAVEVTAAVLVLIPRTAFFGACALAVLILGAAYTHLFRATGEGGMAVVPLVLFALVSHVAWARRPRV